MISIDDIKNQMKGFTCNKMVKAIPMSLVEYHELRKWAPADEDEPGYLVMYEPDGHPNVDGFDGYIFWSPKDTFEKGYQLSDTFTDRLKIEMEDLEEKCEKLEDFLLSSKSESLEEMHKNLLRIQLSAMFAYYCTVRTRFESSTQSEEN